MTAHAAPLQRTVVDGWTMTTRNLTHLVREPSGAIFGVGLPVMFVLVFGYVFGSGMTVPGGGSYREFLIPGIFAMTMLHSMGTTSTMVATDMARGVVDRFRSLPIARSALVAGHSVADLLRSLLEIAVLVVCGLLVGWQWHNGVGALLQALGLLLLLRMAITWMGIYLGLVVPNPDTAGIIVFPLAFPLTAMSNVFVAPELMPSWLGAVATANPLSATVVATRELFGNPGMGNSWVAEHATLLAIAWPLALLAVFVPLAVGRYRRLSR